MRKIQVAALISVLALAACGGSTTPAATAQATAAAVPTAAPATAAPATAAPATAAPTAAKTATPATAAPAASAAATSAPAGAVRKVELSSTNTNYSIATLEVKAGEKIEFVLTNTGDEKHNLVGVGSDVSLVSPDFDSGSTVSWIWTAPTKLGTFKFQCSYHATIPPILVTVK
ncbi:MAG TPA: cupredoxin domain-containing protein [Candidatus Limnocylindria bacterium]|jgi:plastocyanin